MNMYEYCLKHSAVADERAEKRDESDKDLLDECEDTVAVRVGLSEIQPSVTVHATGTCAVRRYPRAAPHYY